MKKFLIATLLLAGLPWLTSAQSTSPGNALLASATTPDPSNSQIGNVLTSPTLITGALPSAATDPASALPAAPAQTDQSNRRFQGELLAFNAEPGAIQAFFGYSFTRFEGFPLKGGVTGDGYNLGMAWYPWNHNFGIQGEMGVGYGNVHGEQSRFLLGMGGPTVRIPYDEGQVEFFVHALGGKTHMSPQTADGSEDGPGFMVGGGMDLKGKHEHLALRLQADMVGTRLYNTTQYSPRIGAGIVFKP